MQRKDSRAAQLCVNDVQNLDIVETRAVLKMCRIYPGLMNDAATLLSRLMHVCNSVLLRSKCSDF